jgi:putative DNA primase/helicase
MTAFPQATLRERTRGRWFGILTALGIHPDYLRNKHGPCPACGGRDRFRWDDKYGDGTFYCNNCGAGSGVDLVMKVRGLPFRDAAPLIESMIGAAPVEPVIKLAPIRREPQRCATLEGLWRFARLIRRNDTVDRWFHNRGLEIEIYPSVLRYHPGVRHPDPPGSFHPAMLAMVQDPAGRPATLHKTYLTADGQKAHVAKPRRFEPGKIPGGSAVRLVPSVGRVLGVAEGIETACAAMRLFGVPTWSCLNAVLLEKFEPPPGVAELVIFGDNDANARGQQAAETLAVRLNIKVAIRIPDQADTDWNDVLRGSRP